MHPLVPGAVVQQGEAGKEEKAKIPLTSCGVGEGCSVALVVGWGGCRGRLQDGAVCVGCPSCHGDQGVWASFAPLHSEHRAWQVFLAVKVGQAETQGESKLTDLEPATSKLNYSGPA